MNGDGSSSQSGALLPTAANLVRPSQVKAMLRAHGLSANRNLGQHFLIDGNIRDHMLAAAALTRQDRVLEVGAGLGTLTLALAQRVEQVVAVEIDGGLYAVLAQAVAAEPRVTLLHGDALDLEPAPYFADAVQAKVVANLPYQITGPILIQLLTQGASGQPSWERLVVMVQQELGQRLTAEPGGRDYGRFTVMVRFFAQAEHLRTVPAAAFLPQPGVTSSLLRLWPRASLATGLAGFAAVVKAAFAQRRKTLANALAGARELALAKNEARQLLRSAGIDPRRRGETLALEEFTALAEAYASWQRLSGPSC